MNFLLYYVQIFWSKRWNFTHKYTHTHKREWDEEKKIREKKNRTRTLAHTIVKTLAQVFFPVFFFLQTRSRASVFICVCFSLQYFLFLPFNSTVFLFVHSFFFVVALNRRCSTCTERIFNILFFIFVFVFFFILFLAFYSVHFDSSFSRFFFVPSILSAFFDLLSEKPVYFFCCPCVKVCFTHTLKSHTEFPGKKCVSEWVCMCVCV